MSSSRWFGSTSHRLVLLVIGLGSIGAAVGAQFAPQSLFDVRSASTPQLLGLLGLLILPAVTACALLADARLLRRRRLSTPSPEQDLAPRQPVSPAVPISAASAAPLPVPSSAPARPSAWPTGPQPARVHPAASGTPTPRRLAPRVEIIVEHRPTTQVLVLSAPKVPALRPAKSAA